MDNSTATQTNDQYSLAKILGIWFLGGAPLWIFAWLVHPVMSDHPATYQTRRRDTSTLFCYLLAYFLIFQACKYPLNNTFGV